MLTYKAPLRDIRFVLYELLGAGDLAQLPGFGEASPDLVDAVLGEAAKFCESSAAAAQSGRRSRGLPLRERRRPHADRIQGGLRAPSPTAAGPGLPAIRRMAAKACRRPLNFVVVEMICATNVAFGTYPGLSRHAYQALDAHAPEAIKRGSCRAWPVARGAARCASPSRNPAPTSASSARKAMPAGDGSYAVTGTKIFISAGEHDLTDNILHLVLARCPTRRRARRASACSWCRSSCQPTTAALAPQRRRAAPASSTRWASTARPRAAASSRTRVGWLVGEPHKGMHCMFTMMNGARLAVGMQGLGLAEVAYQNALAYAQRPAAGTRLTRRAHPDRPADPIIVHPDVRRMLLTMKACIEGCARARRTGRRSISTSPSRTRTPRSAQEADELVR